MFKELIVKYLFGAKNTKINIVGPVDSRPTIGDVHEAGCQSFIVFVNNYKQQQGSPNVYGMRFFSCGTVKIKCKFITCRPLYTL